METAIPAPSEEIAAGGIALRSNPAAHRRMMTLATISLADPGFSRFSGDLWPTEPHSVMLWSFNTFAVVCGGSGGVIGSGVGCHTLVLCGPWTTATHGGVEAWVKRFSKDDNLPRR